MQQIWIVYASNFDLRNPMHRRYASLSLYTNHFDTSTPVYACQRTVLRYNTYHYIAVLICIADPYSRSLGLSFAQTVATFASLASPSYATQGKFYNACMHYVISLIAQTFLVCTWHTVGVVHSADIKLVIWQQLQIDEHLVWRIGQGLP